MTLNVTPPFYPAKDIFVEESESLTKQEIRLYLYLGNRNVLFMSKNVKVNLREAAELMKSDYSSVRRAFRSLIKKGFVEEDDFLLHKGYERLVQSQQKNEQTEQTFMQECNSHLQKEQTPKTRMQQSLLESPDTKETQEMQTGEKKENKENNETVCESDYDDHLL